MRAVRLVRWGGVAAMIGGTLWALWAVLVARLPEGCVEAECNLPGRSVRGYSDLLPLLAAAVLLIAAGVAGVVIRARAAGRFGRLGRWGLVIGAAGAALLATSLVVQGLFFDGDFPLMPAFVIPGGLALAGGFLLFATAVLRVVPRWAGVLLVIGALALLGVNDQNARILLAVPFGGAWMAVGYALWAGRGDLPARPPEFADTP